MVIKKNRIHNPQIVSDQIPNVLTVSDIGRLWFDSNTKVFAIGSVDTNGNYVAKTILDSTSHQTLADADSLRLTGTILTLEKADGTTETADLATIIDVATVIDPNYAHISVTNTSVSDGTNTFSTLSQTLTVAEQVMGDKHFDQGYDFLNNGFVDNYYVSFYELDSFDYTIEIGIGFKLKPKTGLGYSKITFENSKTIASVNSISEIRFSNGDVLRSGFELSPDGRSLFVYCDPEGHYVGKKVTVRFG